MDTETIAVLVVVALIIGFFVWKNRRGGSGGSGSGSGSGKSDDRKRRH